MSAGKSLHFTRQLTGVLLQNLMNYVACSHSSNIYWTVLVSSPLILIMSG
jgi:hypothetical protein